jgi:hypothetical protein
MEELVAKSRGLIGLPRSRVRGGCGIYMGNASSASKRNVHAEYGCDLPCGLHSHAKPLALLGQLSLLAPRTLFRFINPPALSRVGKLWCQRVLVCPPKCDRRADPRDVVPIFSQPRFSPRILEPLKIPRRNPGQATSPQRRESMPAGGSFDLRRGGQSVSAETCWTSFRAGTRRGAGCVGC